MKNKEIKTVVPKLRFPEFQETEEWDVKPLAKIAYVVAGQSPEGSNCNDIGVGIPFYQGKTDFGEIFLNFPTKWTTKVTKTANEGDILMSVRAPVGALNISTNEICIGRGLAAIQPYQNKWFLYYFLSSIKNSIIGNGGSVFDSINKDQIEKIRILIPKNPKEQQKIADCLSSIDDLITSTVKKIESLKAHKKGLIQQLFPIKGKKIPVIRFPEFQNAGEWKEKLLEQISSGIFDGTHQTPRYVERGIPFFSVENVVSGVKNKFISQEDYIIATSKNKPQKGDILITRIGRIGKSVVVNWEYEFSVYVTLAVIKKSVQFDSYYLHSFFQTNLYQTELQNKSLLNAVPCKINMEALRKTRVLLPPEMNEQQKIANCLSSLDELITALTQKLEALKTHKKGLMQQLFPGMTE